MKQVFYYLKRGIEAERAKESGGLFVSEHALGERRTAEEQSEAA
jgi:hypothetical protein